MDPLSIAGSVAGLVGLTIEITKLITAYADSVKNAAEESLQLAQELSALQSTLDELSRFLKSQSAKPSSFSPTSTLVLATSSCYDSLKILQDILGKFMQVSEGKKWYRKLAWPLKREDHLQAVSTIHRFTQIFHFSLSIDGCVLLSQTSEEIMTLQRAQDNTADDVNEILVLVEKLDINMQDWTSMQQKHVEALQNVQKDNKRQELLRWLNSSSDPSISHNLALKKREPETGTWFLESAQFYEWMSSAGCIWLYGIPGGGKTILCSTIIEAINEICAVSTHRKCAYFYFDFQRTSELNVESLLRSLLRQICSNEVEIPSAVQELNAKHGQTGHQPSTKELEEALLGVANGLQKRIYIILDALDEVPANAEYQKRNEVLKLLERMATSRCPNIHILVTSRDELDIRLCLGPLSNGGICIQTSLVDADIKKYVRSCLRDDDRLRNLAPHMKEMIEAKLGEKSRGMFRWAFCQMETFRTCRKPGDIKRALETLPVTLDETYERILVDMSKYDKEEGLAILTWMLHSGRPLTLQEVAEAAIMRPGDDPVDADDRLFDPSEVFRICRSLISVAKQNIYMYGDWAERDIVIFSHFSIQEYLLSGRSEVFSRQTESAHVYIGDCCLSNLLQLRHHELTQQSLEENPLLQYAAEHWPTHLGRLNNNTDSSALFGRLYGLFDETSPCFLNWLRIYDLTQSNYPNWSQFQLVAKNFPSPLFYACSLSLLDTARQLVKAGSDVNKVFPRLGTPLHAASQAGNPHVVRLLLEHGADVHSHDKKVGTPLEAAAIAGHEQIVRVLLEHRADVNGPSSHMFDSILQATLQYSRSKSAASKLGHILLDHGADCKRPGGFYGPALAIASGYGMEDIIKRLLADGANVNARGSAKYGNALIQAAAGGHIQVVRWLLEKGADTESPGCRKYSSALQAAAQSGSLQLVDLLVDHGAKVNISGGWYGSALQAAAKDGYHEVISRLLDLGADINEHDQGEYDPGPALKAAAECGHEKTVQLLLSRGADKDLQGGKGRDDMRGTAVQAASLYGYLQVVGLLVDAGADVNLPGRDYGSALQAAAGQGHYNIVQFLLSRGADINAQGDKKEEKLVEDLELYLAQRHFKEYGNALQAASANGYYQIVQLLIDSGANVNAKNDDYGTAMESALEKGEQEIVRLLQKHGASKTCGEHQ